MSNKISSSTKSKIDNLFDDEDEQQVVEKEVAISSVRPSSVTKSDEKTDKKPTDKKTTKIIDNTPIKKRIVKLYSECLKSAKLKDKEGILSTYVEELYNPKTSKLDEGNLLLNLTILSMLQELNVIDFYFDDSMKNLSNHTYHLDYKWYDDIMKQSVDEQAKYVHVLESNFKLIFYKAMFESIVKSADKMAYNKTKVKMKNVWKFIDDETSTGYDIEEYFVEFIEEKTPIGSIIMITPDLTPFFKLDSVNDEAYMDKPYIKLLGKWKGRFIHEIDTTQVSYLNGFKRGAFFIKEGNRYVINPTKPLMYFNTVANPFIEKPILMLTESLDFNFYGSASTFLRIEDM